MKNKNNISTLILFLLVILFSPVYGYSNELQSAYTWAYNNWITTQSTIDKANMNWEITRIELSKMISNYATKILKKKVDASKKCVFTDITSKIDKQYDNWVTKACQLWLMWQWITKFRPYDKVTRAEFWTILSRALYWETFKSKNQYYSRHITALNSLGIMNNTKNIENTKEIRWYVMLMLKRWLKVKDYKLSIVTINEDNIDELINQTWDLLLYKNEVYWFEVLLWKKRKNARIKHQVAGQWWQWFFNDGFYFWIPMDARTHKLAKWDDECIQQWLWNCVGFNAVSVHIAYNEEIENNKSLLRFSSENNDTRYWWVRNNKTYLFNINSNLYWDLVYSVYDDEYCYEELTDWVQDIPYKQWICPYYFTDNFFNNFEIFNI